MTITIDGKYEVEVETGYYNLYAIKKMKNKDGNLKEIRDQSNTWYGISNLTRVRTLIIMHELSKKRKRVSLAKYKIEVEAVDQIINKQLNLIT